MNVGKRTYVEKKDKTWNHIEREMSNKRMEKKITKARVFMVERLCLWRVSQCFMLQ